MAEQNPIYQGAQYEPGRASGGDGRVGGRAAADVAAPVFAEGWDGVAKNLAIMDATYRQRFKNLRDNENQLALQALAAEYDTDLQRRLSLPNGAADGFYSADGAPNIDKLNRYVQQHVKAAMRTNKGYMLPEDADARNAYLNEYAQQAAQKATAALLHNVTQRARQAADQNIALALERQDLAGARAAAQQAGASGVYTPQEAALQSQKIENAGVVNDYESHYYSGRLDECAKMLRGGMMNQAWNPAQRAKAARELDKTYQHNFMVNMQPLGVNATKKASQGDIDKFITQMNRRAVLTMDEAALAPAIVNGNCTEEDVLDAAKRDAAAIDPQANLNEYKAEYVTKWSPFFEAMNIPKSAMNSILDEAVALRKQNSHGRIDVKGMLDSYAISSSIYDNLRRKAENEAEEKKNNGPETGWIFKDHAYYTAAVAKDPHSELGQLFRMGGVTERQIDKMSNEQIRTVAEDLQARQKAAEIKRAVEHHFNAWYAGDGKDSSEDEQFARLQIFLKETAGVEMTSEEDQRELRAIYDTNISEQKKAYENYKKGGGRELKRVAPMGAQSSGRGVYDASVDISLQGAPAEKGQEGVRVPQEWIDRGIVKVEADSCRLRISNGREAEFPIVGVSSSGAVEMTEGLVSALGYENMANYRAKNVALRVMPGSGALARARVGDFFERKQRFDDGLAPAGIFPEDTDDTETATPMSDDLPEWVK